METLQQLKARANVQPDHSFSLKSYLESGRRVYAAAISNDSRDNVQEAYVGYLKLAALLSVAISHPEYAIARRERNKEFLTFQELQAKWVPVKQRVQELTDIIQKQTNDTSSPASIYSPTLSQTSVPTSPAMPSSEDAPSSSKRDSIQERLAALRSAGMDAQSTNAKRARPLPQVDEQVVETTPKRPLPIVPLLPVSNGILPNTNHADTSMHDSPTVPAKHLEEVRSGSAPPTTPSFASEPSEPNFNTLSIESPTELDFSAQFPSLDTLEHQFPDLPSAPRGEPSTSTSSIGLGKPPTTFPSVGKPPTGFPIDLLQEKPKEERAPLVPASQRRASQTTPTFNLPKSTAILPVDLWKYISAAMSPSILLIDVRSRPQHDRLRIATFGKSNVLSMCIEPIVLRQSINSKQLESALFDAPDVERSHYRNRAAFDLVVFYDDSTSALPATNRIASTRGVGGYASAPELWTLNQSIYVEEFTNPLKRPPVLLIGGLEAWKKTIGLQGLAGADVKHLPQTNEDSDAITDAKRSLEGENKAGRERSASSSVSSSSNKRQNRKATLSGGDLYTSPPIARSVGDVIGHPQSPTTSSFQPTSRYNQSQHTMTPTPSMPALAFANPRTVSDSSYPQFPQQAMQRLPSSKSVPHHINTSMPLPLPSGMTSPTYEQPQSRYIDYPSLVPPPPVYELQRPILAQIPSSYNTLSLSTSSTRPSGLAPQNRRMSSNTYASLPGSPVVSGLSASRIPLDWRDGVVGLTGLKNLGNTCYMNSTLQCLSATIPFAKFFTDGSYRKQVNTVNHLGTKGALANTVAQLFSVLWSEQYTFVSPVTFRDAICHFAPQFRGTDQHDSQEFLAFLLDGLHEDLNLIMSKPKQSDLSPEKEAELEALPTAAASALEWERYLSRDNSLIVSWFQGQYRSRLQCLTCHKTSTTFNAFMYLSLPIPSSKKPISLESAVSTFVSEEILEKSDSWHCPNCKQDRKASKRLTLARLPPILLIHLKRFSFKGPFSDKIDTPIQFPVYGLDLSPFLPAPSATDALYSRSESSPKSTYDLYGVSQHFGTLSSGHYTAMIRSRNTWNHISDSKIQPVDESEVRKALKSSYILFYRRN